MVYSDSYNSGLRRSGSPGKGTNPIDPFCPTTKISRYHNIKIPLERPKYLVYNDFLINIFFNLADI